MKTKRVLIVDDDHTLVRVLTVRCQHLGLDVTQSSDAAHARTCIRESPPDLILLDMNLPAGNGLSLCEALASDSALPPIPVIILTGWSSPEIIQKCEALGAHYVLKSPQAWHQLKPIICELLGIADEASHRVASAMDSRRPTPTNERDQPKILVIDDDADLCRAIKIRLGAVGLDVVQAFSGMQGYWTALKEKPDVIITDFTMPDGEGNFLIGRLKSNPITENTPVFVLSGRNVDGQQDFALERDLRRIGAEEYFMKPPDFDAILAALRLRVRIPDMRTEPQAQTNRRPHSRQLPQSQDAPS